MITNTPLSPTSRGAKRKRNGSSLVEPKPGIISQANDLELPSSIQQELDNLPDFPHRPLPAQRAFSPPQRAVTQPRSFKNQHHLALTEILHRSLREADFKRADRAFTLLLRLEHRGDTLDIRKDDNWRIAIEILLHREDGQQGAYAEGTGGPGKLAGGPDRSHRPFSRRAFADSKEFYQRLVLQYPYQRAHPKAISALTFYPAFFTLWIYQIQSQYHTARSDSTDMDMEHLSSPVSPRSRSPLSEDTKALESGGRDPCGRAIKDADEVRNRLADVLLMPPYDNDAQLLDLHAMVCTWIADLREEHISDESAIADLRAQASLSRARASQSRSKSNDGIK
ncbi:MAG: hypothetical protein M1831_005196 [Alyxoria varia]|nr:MAG: hypothetical protein M1831_005196 [Alyxoria varia]